MMHARSLKERKSGARLDAHRNDVPHFSATSGINAHQCDLYENGCWRINIPLDYPYLKRNPRNGEAAMSMQTHRPTGLSTTIYLAPLVTKRIAMNNHDSVDGKSAPIANLVAAYDRLDQEERLLYSTPEDRKWMLVQKKPGRAEYYERFRGPDEIIEWMETALLAERGGYIPEKIRIPLVDLSRKFDQKIFNKLGRKIEDIAYNKYIGQWNADDFHLANAYPVPSWQQIGTVLDFGAGYGRQANLWHQMVEGLRYIALDVIRKPYLCQCSYFQFFDIPYSEYVLNPKGFRIHDKPGIYHLPSWRWDLVNDSSVDMILAIMVLPELHPITLFRTLDQFKRVLRPGGALFIRDHGLIVKSANTEDVATALGERGFVLEFRPYVKDQTDLRGIPRIWRKRVNGVQVADEVVS